MGSWKGFGPTSTGGGPALSTTRTLEPSCTRVPGDGLWEIAVPAVAESYRVVNMGRSFRRCAFARFDSADISLASGS